MLTQQQSLNGIIITYTQYRAWFTAALQPYNTPAQVYTDFDVGFSVEFELTADSGDSASISVLPEANDAFGASLFMDDDLVVAGMYVYICIIYKYIYYTYLCTHSCMHTHAHLNAFYVVSA
jgi:hypothetical protein